MKIPSPYDLEAVRRFAETHYFRVPVFETLNVPKDEIHFVDSEGRVVGKIVNVGDADEEGY